MRIDEFYSGEHIHLRRNVDNKKWLDRCAGWNAHNDNNDGNNNGGSGGGGGKMTLSPQNRDGGGGDFGGGDATPPGAAPLFDDKNNRKTVAVETLSGWRHTGRFQKTRTRQRAAVYEGDCASCGFLTQVPFRPVVGVCFFLFFLALRILHKFTHRRRYIDPPTCGGSALDF